MAINIFTASGNVGSDMEIRFTPSQKAIGTFSLPVKSGWGENEKVSWVSCKMFGERAQKLAQYITKGTKLTVTGSFVLDEWENNGVKHSRPVILVNDFEFGDSPQGQSNQGGYQQQRTQQRATPNQPEPNFEFDDSLPDWD